MEARADQEHLQARLMVEIMASQETMEKHAQANEELHRTNEELWRSFRQHGRRPARERSLDLLARDDLSRSLSKSWTSRCHHIT